MNSILTEAGVFDTNVWLRAVRATSDDRVAIRLVARAVDLRIWIPFQVLKEIHTNLNEPELRVFYAFVASSDVHTDWQPPNARRIEHFQALGCKKGDAAVAASVQACGARYLVSANRHFLREVRPLPFLVFSPEETLQMLNED